MKKNFKSYALIWAIFLVAFNVIVFSFRGTRSAMIYGSGSHGCL